MLTRRQLLRTLPLAAGALAACDRPEPAPRYRLPKRPLEVVTSTVQTADLIRHVGGEAVNVRSLIPPQVNPHLWQPRASDLAAIQLADVFFLSGLGLESRRSPHFFLSRLSRLEPLTDSPYLTPWSRWKR